MTVPGGDDESALGTSGGSGRFESALLEQLPAMVVALTDGDVARVNRRLVDRTGHEPAAVVGDPVAELLPGYEPAGADGPVGTGAELRHADGSREPVSVTERTLEGVDATVLVVEPATDPGTAGGGRDGSPFERLFEHTNDALLVVDVEGGEILRCNARACELFGYDREELLSLSPSDIHPHDYAEFERFVETVYEQGHGWTSRLSCYTRDGETVPAEISAAVVTIGGERRLLASIRDVSERIERERELRRRSAAMDAATDGIAILSPDGTVEYANGAYAELFGYDDPDAVVGAGWGELHDDPRRFELDVRPATVDGGTWRGEVRATGTDGERRPVRASISALDNGELVCVAHDVGPERAHEERLAGLAGASRGLMAAEDREAVCRTAVDVAGDVLGYDLACVWLYDPASNELERAATSDPAAELVAAEPAYDLKASNAGRAYRYGETVRNEPRGDAYGPEPRRADLHVPLDEFGALSVFDPDGEFDDRRVQLVELLAETVRAALVRADREEALRASRSELAAADEFNALVTTVIRSVIRTTSREEIERTVCDRLAEGSLSDAAWVATVDDGVSVTRASGSTEAFPEPDVTAFARSPFAGQLVREAADGGEPIVRYRQFEAAAGDDSPRICAAATPIFCGRHEFGVLAVAAADDAELGETVKGGLELLGEALGFAILADRRREALLSRDGVEIEVGFESPFGDLSAAFDCRCVHQGPVEVEDGTHRYRIRVTHGDPAAVGEFLDGYDVVRSRRIAAERDGECLVDVSVDDPPPEQLAEMGVSLRSLVAEDGAERLVAEVPPELDVADVVDVLREGWEGVELLAKRQEATHPVAAVADGFESELTERQRSVVEKAVGMGYYEWPREHTAEEVADELGIASSTLHQHLRAAESKLFSAFLAE